MSKKARELSPEEKRLWRRVAAGVKGRKAPAELHPGDTDELKEAHPVKPTAPTAAAPKRKIEVRPLAPPADRGGEKKVRRGRIEIEGSLDLHGHTQDGALAALVPFLHRAHGKGARAVIVITGSGRGGEGILKRRLPEWLAQPSVKPLVAGFAQAHRSHGGSGAYYVFLKRK